MCVCVSFWDFNMFQKQTTKNWESGLLLCAFLYFRNLDLQVLAVLTALKSELCLSSPTWLPKLCQLLCLLVRAAPDSQAQNSQRQSADLQKGQMKYKMLFPSLPNHVPQIPAGSHRLLQTIIYCIVSDFLVILSGNVWLMPAALSHLEVQDPTLNFS